MKELSIEQKAKRYDEALEKSKRLYEQGTITESLCYVFPELKESENEKKQEDSDEDSDFIDIPFGAFDSELYHQEIYIPDGFEATIKDNKIILKRKESEDESIRKAIHIYLDWLNSRKDYAPKGKYSIKDMIAWLEKQKVLTEEDLQGKEYVLWCIKQAKKHTKDENEMGTCWLAEQWLEKQGKSYTKKDVDNAYIEGMAFAKSELEKQGEQKPFDYENANIQQKDFTPKVYNDIDPHFFKTVDNVEPKFKIGDWVIFNENQNSAYQVEKIDNYRYYLRHYLGGTLSLHFDNELIRAWSIQDAKDGDVLVASDGSIFLFKCTIDCSCKHYVALTTDGAFKFNEGLEHFWETSRAVHPATKEQRDMLFQKMKEAGYEWDAENKKLNKIEPKDYRNIDPHFFKTVD